MSFSTINNAFAAVAALAISAIVMAAAIVPASPTGFIV
ncbi:enoyl-CoA hydratase [Erythrobacter sp. QSSC1-22B]|nr:enoyl-CoA hydratase [Erythrobacter sp. QSSC1-22B]